MKLSEHTQHLSIKFSVLYVVMEPQNNYNSNIKAQWSQISIINVLIKFEIQHELQKCDKDIEWTKGAEKMALADLL